MQQSFSQPVQDRPYRFFLLFFSRNQRFPIALLFPVITELCMVSALNHLYLRSGRNILPAVFIRLHVQDTVLIPVYRQHPDRIICICRRI
jgi:hypothetical protein